MQEETKRISLHAPKKLKLSLSVLGEFMIDIFRFHWKELGGGGAVEPYKVLNIGFLTKRSIPVGSTERLPKFFDQNQKQAFQTFPCKMIFPKGGVEHLGFLQKQT